MTLWHIDYFKLKGPQEKAQGPCGLLLWQVSGEMSSLSRGKGLGDPAVSHSEQPHSARPSSSSPCLHDFPLLIKWTIKTLRLNHFFESSFPYQCSDVREDIKFICFSLDHLSFVPGVWLETWRSRRKVFFFFFQSFFEESSFPPPTSITNNLFFCNNIVRGLGHS